MLRVGYQRAQRREDRRIVVPGSEPSIEGSDHQDLADADLTTSDADQTGADLDQTAADVDQAASESDQASSDRDQHASDLDEAALERAVSTGTDGTSFEADRLELVDALDDSRRTRSQSTHERDAASQARDDTTGVRESNADRRDRRADDRDAAARDRELLAASLDAEIERQERERPLEAAGMDVLLRGSRHRKNATASRARAAEQRDAAGRDRELAARDRLEATLDRRAAGEELAAEGVDQLTGALRRRVGMAALQREIDRTTRTGETLVLAFVDVDGLEVVNDQQGHAAGDRLLEAVAHCLSAVLRPYDVVMRYGGDEFVCALAGDLAGVRERFAGVAARIAETAAGATVTVGLVEHRDGEALDDLVFRADAAMLALRNGGAARRS